MKPKALINFGQALEELKKGNRVQRIGWNGKGMWLHLVVMPDYAYIKDFKKDELVGEYKQLDYLAMKTADDKWVPWLASQTDILAEDWQVVE